MAEIVVRIDGLAQLQNGLAAGASQINSQVKWAMVQSVNVVKNSAQRLAPYKTGTLRRSIFTEVRDSGFTGIVGQDGSIAPYGVMMEYGTRAHQILPRNARALFWPGAAHPVRRVNHPGTAARPFMTPAIEGNIATITRYFNAALDKVVQTMAGKGGQ